MVENIRRVADKCAISIGGNFDASSADSYPALLDFLNEQDFAGLLRKVAFNRSSARRRRRKASCR